MVNIEVNEDYSILMNDLKTVVHGTGVGFDGKFITLKDDDSPIHINTSYIALCTPSKIFDKCLNYVNFDKKTG